MMGDIYVNAKTGKKSIVTDMRGDQTCFALIDNPKRKFQLTKAQMSNMKLSVEDTPPKFYVLPTVPNFIKESYDHNE